MLILYNLFIQFFFAGIRVASLWNKKAAVWIEGRSALFSDLENEITPDDKIIWMHCASAGEFEQGKPLIEALKSEYPEHKMLISFFSPSGFEVAKNYSYADYITYLPLDTPKNAARFLQLIRPELVIFIKYEFWYHHLSAAAFRHIPLILVSAVFRKDQVFFKPYGKFFRQMLFLFRHIFVQDLASLELLLANGITHCSSSGDTRFDRVTALASHFSEIDFVQDFIGDKEVIVAGSTWAGDEELLAAYLKDHLHTKLILAPHEITPGHISAIRRLFPPCVLYSGYEKSSDAQRCQVLVIDSIGLLSRLYKYATVTYVGGGFTKDGIHNILEAAVWGKPVLFGPNYKKYREAGELIKAGGGFSISSSAEFEKLASALFTEDAHRQAVGAKAERYVKEGAGATKVILEAIQAKRLLTRL